MDYPVMNPEFSQQMLSGNVFPSAPPGARTSPATSVPNAETAQNRAIPDSGGRPLPGHAPGHPGGHGQAPGSGPQPQQHAANMMSPVGQQYPQVDWAEAAAAPARALPPWMMIALFMAAIGVALVLTIVIAKIAR